MWKFVRAENRRVCVPWGPSSGVPLAQAMGNRLACPPGGWKSPWWGEHECLYQLTEQSWLVGVPSLCVPSILFCLLADFLCRQMSLDWFWTQKPKKACVQPCRGSVWLGPLICSPVVLDWVLALTFFPSFLPLASYFRARGEQGLLFIDSKKDL